MNVFFQHHPCIQSSTAIGQNFKNLNTGVEASVALLRPPLKPLPQALSPRYFYLPFWVLHREAEKAFLQEAERCVPCLFLCFRMSRGGSRISQMQKRKPPHTIPSPSLLLFYKCSNPASTLDEAILYFTLLSPFPQFYTGVSALIIWQ